MARSRRPSSSSSSLSSESDYENQNNLLGSSTKTHVSKVKPTPAKKYKRIADVASSGEDNSMPLSVLKKKLLEGSLSAADTQMNLLTPGTKNEKSLSFLDLDMSLMPKKIKAQRVRAFDDDLNFGDDESDVQSTPGPHRSRRGRTTIVKKVEVDDLDLDAIENMNPNKVAAKPKLEKFDVIDDVSESKPLFKFTNLKPVKKTVYLPNVPGEDVKLWIKEEKPGIKEEKYKIKEEKYDVAGPSLWRVKKEEKPCTSSVIKEHSYSIDLDMYDFNRPDHVHGRIHEAQYEDQKALTIAKLTEIQETLTSRPKPTDKADQPESLKIPLKMHQLQGLKFMIWRESRSNPGGIIADEMGLGKTGLAIGLIVAQLHLQVQQKAASRSERHKGGTLIVTPASLLHQWQSEIDKFCRRRTLRVCINHGLDREKSPMKLALNYDVVLTTFALVGRAHEGRSTVFAVKWDRIILDEGHSIRNYRSIQSMACCDLHAIKRWVLTGTPIQNKELDMFSLFKFLRFEPFNDLLIWKRFVATTNTQKDRLRVVLENVMLRRTKAELEAIGAIPPLPKKEFIEMKIFLSDDEQAVHNFFMTFSQAVFAKFAEQHIQKHPELTEMLRNYEKGTNKLVQNLRKKFVALFGTSVVQQHHILVLLLRMRQITCHPSLILGILPEDYNLDLFDDTDDEGDLPLASSTPQTKKPVVPKFDFLAELTKLMQKKPKPGKEEDKSSDDEDGTVSNAYQLLSRDNPVFNPKKPSTKMIEMMPRLMEKIEADEKVIVVSTFVSFLNIIGRHLKERGIDYFIFSGKTTIPMRNEIVTEFNSSRSKTKVLLLSMLAGGVGLNLVGANNMFILDLYWNPQMELQVMDRIHRFGQVKSVTIIKFVCTETIEEQILGIQNTKLEIARNALGGQRLSNKLTIDDIRKMLGM